MPSAPTSRRRPPLVAGSRASASRSARCLQWESRPRRRSGDHQARDTGRSAHQERRTSTPVEVKMRKHAAIRQSARWCTPRTARYRRKSRATERRRTRFGTRPTKRLRVPANPEATRSPLGVTTPNADSGAPAFCRTAAVLARVTCPRTAHSRCGSRLPPSVAGHAEQPDLALEPATERASRGALTSESLGLLDELLWADGRDAEVERRGNGKECGANEYCRGQGRWPHTAGVERGRPNPAERSRAEVASDGVRRSHSTIARRRSCRLGR